MAKGQHQANQGAPRAHIPSYRRFLRGVRHGLARLAHPRRRTHAIARLERCGIPQSILAVCVGNICRSPYTAALLRRHLGEFLDSEHQIQSAGFIGPGRPSPDEAIRSAGRRNIDLSGHRSQLITEKLVRGSELIIVVSEEQAHELRNRFPLGRTQICLLGDLDPESIDTRAIQDPFEREPQIFERSFARIDRCVAEFVRAVTRRARVVQPG